MGVDRREQVYDCCDHVAQDDFEGEVPGRDDVVSLIGVSGCARTSQGC
jgi:hypothetical protein